MVKSKLKKGEKVPHTKYSIPFYNENHFNPKVNADEDTDIIDHKTTTISVPIDPQGGSDKSNYIKITCPTITDWEDAEQVIKVFKTVDDEIMPKKATGIMSEDIKSAWTFKKHLVKSTAALSVFNEAEKTARTAIAEAFYKLEPGRVGDQSWGLSEDRYRSFIINSKMFFQWMAAKDQATDDEKAYFGKQGLTGEEYYLALWTNYDNRVYNELIKHIFGDKFHKALEEEKSYLTNCIVKPFGTSISTNFSRIDELCTYFYYFPPTTVKDELPTDEQWENHRKEHTRVVETKLNRKIKFGLLPAEFQNKLERPEVDDWQKMSNAKFNHHCFYIEEEDTKARETREANKEKLKNKKSKFESKHGSDLSERIPRKDKDKNSRSKRDRESYEKKPINTRGTRQVLCPMQNGWKA